MSSSGRIAVAAGVLALAAPGPASAATTSCGAVAGVGGGTSVTKVAASGGTCLSAKTVAKKFARTRLAPAGFACREKFTATTSANVTCTRPGRKITFRVKWTGFMPLPAAPALPSAGGS